ncbi:MAG: glycosyltransferase family 2 protein [Chromatiaceae bacterium]|jgi:glycosyltransferase involved in cell wall biosynthesis
MADHPHSLSVVVPMYNEGELLGVFFARIRAILKEITEDFEILCVNDGSTDDTLDRLRDFAQADPRIKVLSLTRNFGKEAALTAGLDYASGDAVIPMDADLQDPPELIPTMVEKWREGFDMVIAVRQKRSSDAVMKRASARGFYWLASKLSDTPIPANAGDFRLLDRQVVLALRKLPERTRFMKGLFGWLGFKQAKVYYARPERAAGRTKWRFWGLWNLALDGIFSFSTLPLRMWTYLGALLALVSLSYGAYIVIRTVLFGVDIPGYASLATMILFFSGINMVGLGIIGEYLGRVFLETKARPLYLIRESIGLDPVS